MLLSLPLWLAEHAVSQQGVDVSACEVVQTHAVHSAVGEVVGLERRCHTSSPISSTPGAGSHQQLQLDNWSAHDDTGACWTVATRLPVQQPTPAQAAALAGAGSDQRVEHSEHVAASCSSSSSSSSSSLRSSSGANSNGELCKALVAEAGATSSSSTTTTTTSSSQVWSEFSSFNLTCTPLVTGAAQSNGTGYSPQQGSLVRHGSTSKQHSSCSRQYSSRSRQYTLAVKLQDSLGGVTPEEHRAAPLPGKDVLQQQHLHLSAALAAACQEAAYAVGRAPASVAKLLRTLVFKGCVQYVLQFAEAVGAVEQEQPGQPQAAAAEAAAAAAAGAGEGAPEAAAAAAGAALEAPPADNMAAPVGPAAAAAGAPEGPVSADDDGMTTAAIMLNIAAPMPIAGSSSSGSGHLGGVPVSLQGSPAMGAVDTGAQEQALWAAVQEQLQQLQLDELPGDIQGLSYQLLLDGVLLQPAHQGAASSICGGFAGAGPVAPASATFCEGAPRRSMENTPDDVATAAAAATAAAGCVDMDAFSAQVVQQQHLLQQHQQAHQQQLLQQVCLDPVVLALQPHWAQLEAGGDDGSSDCSSRSSSHDDGSIGTAGGHLGSAASSHSNSSGHHIDSNCPGSNSSGNGSKHSSSSSDTGGGASSSSSKQDDSVQWPAFWSTLRRAALGLSKTPAVALGTKAATGAVSHPVTQPPSRTAPAAASAGPPKSPPAPPPLHVAHMALQLPLQLPRMWREQGYTYLRVAVGDAASLAGALVNATWCLEQLSAAVSDHEACSRAGPSTTSGASSSSAAAASSTMVGPDSQLQVVGGLLRVPVNIALTKTLLQQLVPVGFGVLPLVVLLGQGPARGKSIRCGRDAATGTQQQQPQQQQQQQCSSSSSGGSSSGIKGKVAGCETGSPGDESAPVSVQAHEPGRFGGSSSPGVDGSTAGGSSPQGSNRSRRSSSSHGHLPPELLVLSVAVVVLQPPAASELTNWMQQLVAAMEGTPDQGLAFQLYMLPLLMDLAYCITSLAGGVQEAPGDQQLAVSVCFALLTYFHDQGLLECKMLVHGLLSGHQAHLQEGQEGPEQQQQQEEEDDEADEGQEEEQQQQQSEAQEQEQDDGQQQQQQQQGDLASSPPGGQRRGWVSSWLLPRWWD